MFSTYRAAGVLTGGILHFSVQSSAGEDTGGTLPGDEFSSRKRQVARFGLRESGKKSVFNFRNSAKPAERAMCSIGSAGPRIPN
jgi:hypothetical protein